MTHDVVSHYMRTELNWMMTFVLKSSCLDKCRIARGTTRECKSHKNTGKAPRQTSVMGCCHIASVQWRRNPCLCFKPVLLWLIHPDSVDCS